MLSFFVSAEPGRKTRIGLVLAAIFFVCTISLTFAGFQALLPVLYDEGIYSDLCAPNEPQPCPAQRQRFSTLYTVATAACNVCLFAGGLVHDKLGTRVYGIVAGMTLSLGNVLFALDQFFVGFSLIAVGNTFVIFSVMHYANLFPRHRSLLICLFRSLEPLSAGTYSVLSLAHYRDGMGHQSFFLVTTCFPVFYCVFSISGSPDLHL